MIIKNFKIAIRILISHSKYTLINILGLAIGLACFILITIWVQDELSFDNFHEDADNVHIVFRKENGKSSGVSSKLLAPTIKEELPEVLEATCFRQLPEAFSILFQYKENSFVEKIAMADNQFFKVFSFPLLKGDPSTAFSDPNSVVITERMSQKYFVGEEALGKTFSITAFGQKKLLTVSGVLENIPHNSHIQSELILPIEFMNYFGAEWDMWGNYSVSTYIRTQDNVSSTQLEEKILACKDGHFSEENMSYSVLPITKIHLNTSDVGFFTTTGDIKYVYIFSAIAAIILLIACMNYMNLSNALSLKRSKEIGIRKTLGSKRIQVIQQYFGETLILVFIALFFSIFMVQIYLPVLNYLSAKSLTIPYTSPQFILTILGIVLATSLISGIYPALFVSGFQPIKVLKGKFVSSTQSINIRKGLVVFQFVLSILIIIGAITVSNQLKFIQSINLGYDKEHVVCATIKEDISKKYEAFKNEMLLSGNVLNVSRSENMQAAGMSSTSGVNWPGKQQKFNTWVLDVDDEFAETYGIKMNDGRFYSRDFATDLTNGFVINQTAANEMGFENPIGQEFTMWGRKGTIIGVTNDFHFSSLHNKIEPLIFHIPEPENVNRSYRVLSMRIKPNSMPQSLDYIKKTWKTYFPNENFEYYFMDEKLKANYVSEARMGTLFKYFSFLVIFIACLGLYGLTAFTIEQKNKEIGIRKVNGAKVSEILTMLNKDFIKWVAIAFIIATPIAYYVMNKWLENFAYKTTLSWWIFALAGVITLGIALLTVSWQSWRAASKNPIEALRYE